MNFVEYPFQLSNKYSPNYPLVILHLKYKITEATSEGATLKYIHRTLASVLFRDTDVFSIFWRSDVKHGELK